MKEFCLHLDNHPLDLKLCLRSGQVFGWQEESDGIWTGKSGQDTFRFSLEDGNLMTQSAADPSKVAQLFGLHLDLKQAKIDCLKMDPTLDSAFESFAGLRLMQPDCLSEVIFTFLCTSNNHLSRIEGMIRRFREINPEWPSPEEIAQISESTFRDWGFGYRGKSIPLVAGQLARLGPKWESELRTMDYLTSRCFLQTLPGVGPKLADCIALYGLHHLQAVPVDTHLWQAVTRRYFQQWNLNTPTDRRMWEVGELLRDKFGDWAGYVQLLLYYENMQIKRSRISNEK